MFGLGRKLRKYGGSMLAGGLIGGPLLKKGLGMFGGGGKPRAPNPYDMANAQLGMNRDAAFSSLINQSGPFGSVNYSRNPDGSFSSQTTLGSFGQGAYDEANKRLGMFSSRFGTGPSDFSGDRQKYEDAMYSRHSSRLDPQYQDMDRALQSRLAAQGITQGSEAYQREMDNFNRERRSAYDEARTSSILGGGDEMSRMFDMSSRERDQQFGEIGGLFGLSAANAPQAIGHAGVGSPDLMAAIMARYGIDMGAYNARQQGQAQILGSLIGGGAMLAGGGGG